MELEENAVIKELQTIFLSNNENAIHDAIAYIHENGSIKMVPLLFDLLATEPNDTIKNDIFNCLMDTKDANAVPLFIDAIQNPSFRNDKQSLLSTLWQANLDFSKYTDLFISIMINDNYECAIEAFTLIEVCSENLSPDEKEHFTKILTEALQKDRSEKATLIQAAINLMK